MSGAPSPAERIAWQEATVTSVIAQTASVKSFFLQPPQWHGFIAGPACRRPPHRAGRLSGAAQLFDRLGTGRRHDRARRREARGRRGLALLPRRRPARRHDRDARSDRRPLQLGRRATVARSSSSAAAPASCRWFRCSATALPSPRRSRWSSSIRRGRVDEVIFRDELMRRATGDPGFSLALTLTREAGADARPADRPHRPRLHRRGVVALRRRAAAAQFRLRRDRLRRSRQHVPDRGRVFPSPASAPSATAAAPPPSLAQTAVAPEV